MKGQLTSKYRANYLKETIEHGDIEIEDQGTLVGANIAREILREQTL